MAEHHNAQHFSPPMDSSNEPLAQSNNDGARDTLDSQPSNEQLQAIDRRRRLYGSTQLSDRASAVLGDVVHHNYYYGGNVPYFADLSVSQDSAIISPDAISPYDARLTLWLKTQLRLSNTCTWLTNTNEFHKWLDRDTHPIFVCSGSVGCGKSVAAGFVIESLSSASSEGGIVISYFVDASREQATTTSEVLRALIKQILQKSEFVGGVLCERVRQILKPTFPSSQVRPGVLELAATLKRGMVEFSPCFCVIDGMDAMPEQEISSLLEVIAPIFAPNTMRKLAVFCRPSLGRGVNIEQMLKPVSVHFGVDDLRGDLQLFVHHGVDSRQQKRAITADPKLVKAIKNTLISHCAKMFLWIQLQLTSLWDPNVVTCDEDVWKQLISLPDGLEETYVRCLRRIEVNADIRSQEIAARTFRWIACARYPLTSLQAREAVSMSADKMPLVKSRLLSLSVEDYCANLVTKDELTGRIVFPHPTVKDFLRDSSRLPSDLSKYLLSPEKDNLWCGEICLAYVYYLHSRKQVVRYAAQSVPHNVAASIVRDVPGGWITSIFRQPPTTVDFRIPLPVGATTRSDQILDCTLHDYMRQHWLSHNQRIDPSAMNYETFHDLCLSFTHEILPWVEKHTAGTDCFRKLVEYAVLTDHVPLLRLAQTHIQQKKPHLLKKVFQSNCPGTDFGWLHVSVTLGSEQIVDLLSRVCNLMALDSQGRSAAVLAIENEHSSLVPFLIPRTLGTNLWGITNPAHAFLIGILRSCATRGDTFSTNILIQRLGFSLTKQYLSDALLHACKNGRISVASILVDAGADPKRFDLLPKEIDYYRQHFGLQTLTIPSRELAAQLKDDKFWDTLVDLGVGMTGVKFMDDESSSFMLVKLCERESDIDHMVYLLTSSSFVPALRELRGASFTWIEVLIQCMNVNYDMRRRWGWLARAMLHQLADSILRGEIAPAGIASPIPGSATTDPLIHWVQYVPDDILVHIMRLKWISVSALLDLTFIDHLAQRPSSRGLEAWSASMGFENVLRSSYNHLNREINAVQLSDLLAYQRCDDICERAALSKYVDVSVENFLRHVADCSVSQWKQKYSSLLTELLLSRAAAQNEQVKVFIEVYENLSADQPMLEYFNHMELRQDYINLIGQTSQETSRAYAQVPLPLMWRRFLEDNIFLTARECSELLTAGCTGNFYLNWPAGYITESAATKTGHPTLRMGILLAVYGWNFRLNRQLRKPYSQADMWYAAAVLRNTSTTVHVV